MIIIPTYNERENIETLVGRIRAAVGDMGILFVDDNSPDGTAELIDKLRTNDSNIHLLRRGKKMGLGSAYVDAFKFLEKQPAAEFAVTMDADLSHDPDVLPELISRLSTYAVVVGSRYVDGGRIRNWSLSRQLLSRSGNFYARVFTGVPIADLTSGFAAYRLDWLRRVDLGKLRTDGYAFQIEMKYLLHRAAASIYEHPIIFTERREGRSKLSSSIVLEDISFPLKVFLKRLMR